MDDPSQYTVAVNTDANKTIIQFELSDEHIVNLMKGDPMTEKKDQFTEKEIDVFRDMYFSYRKIALKSKNQWIRTMISLRECFLESEKLHKDFDLARDKCKEIIQILTERDDGSHKYWDIPELVDEEDDS